jgi:hypothetical protein
MEKLCLCGCGQTFRSERNRVFYSIECRSKYNEKVIEKSEITRICKCGCGREFQINHKNKSKIYYSQKCCQNMFEFVRQLRLDSCSELYKKDMEVMRSQAFLKNMIKTTLRVILLDAEPDDRSWIERKYPCNNPVYSEREMI